MRRLAVISDTHFDSDSKKLPTQLIQKLQGVDIICHLGDLTTLNVLDLLSQITQVYAISGNMDSTKVHSLLPTERIIDIEECKIAMIHGWGAPLNLEMKVYKHFLEIKPSIILFGHTHIPMIYYYQNTWLCNPGSLSIPRFGVPTMAFLKIDGSEITPEIHTL